MPRLLRVGVEDDDHLIAEPPENSGVLRCQGSTHGGDHVGQAVLMSHKTVGVALDNDGLVFTSDGLAGCIEAIDAGTLVEEDGLGRIEILGPGGV